MKRLATIPLIISLAVVSMMILFLQMHQQPLAVLAAPEAATYFVDAATGDDNNDCLSSVTACLTVGAAITKAVDGDAIQVAAGVYDEFLDISKAITITGAGPEVTFLDGGDSHRVLRYSGVGWLNLAELSVSHGRVTDENGAGIYNFGWLNLQNVHLSHNNTNNGGGAVFNSGHIRLQNSQVFSNSVDGVGGGFYIWYSGVVTVTNSDIANNSAQQGGGFFNLGDLVIEESTLQGNSGALFGGALTVFTQATTELTNVTIVGNQSDGSAAGIYNSGAPLTMTNVTISGNDAPTNTGLTNLGADSQTRILNSTITNNFVSGPGVRHGGIANVSSGNLTIKNSIVADNEGRNCSISSSGTWLSEGYNLSSDHYCNLTATGDLPSTAPLLYPLADYGGATWTHALQPGSPAIDAADNADCPVTDQRGVTRPFDGDNDSTAVCDIGAVELRNQIEIEDVTVEEGDAGTTNAVFTVTLSPPSSQPISLNYETADDTAEAGSDYITDLDMLTFNPGETTKFITIAVLGDTDDEANETFFLNLSGTLEADIVDGQAVGTIVDDDGLPSLTIAEATIDEGNTGTAVAEFTVTLSPASSDTVQVNYTTADGTAVAGDDYTTVMDTLTFAPGETSKTIEVDVLGDVIDEGDEEVFYVNLSSPVNATVVDDTAVGTITDDEIARVSMGFGQSALEGDVGTTTLVFTVTLDFETDFAVTVDYESSSGIGGTFATPGVDYTEVSGTLHFAPGEMMKTLTVPILGDHEIEDDEHFSVRLTNADPVSIYTTSATGNILNDDSEGEARFVYLPIVLKP